MTGRNELWARTVVDELVRSGVRHAALAPGSRSTPLVLALAARAEIRLATHLDERSAAFFALGVGKATGAPAAVLTTSGTAAANLYPAVVEASASGTPLLLLTADRPHRLRGADANQAIDQLRLYGPFVRAFHEVAPPTVEDRALRHLRSLACRAVADARGEPAGPVHLNFPFDKPLEPSVEGDDVPPGFADAHPLAWAGREDGAPFTVVDRRSALPPDEDLAEVAALLAGSPRGLVVAGPVPDPDRAGPAARALAAAAGWPLLADPLSGARFGSFGGAEVLGAYDLFLAEGGPADELRPEAVVRVGQAPTSARLAGWLERSGAATVVVDPSFRWKDHQAMAARVLRGDPARTLAALAARVAGRGPGGGAGSDEGERRGWRASWRRLEDAAREVVEASATGGGEGLEGALVAAAVRSVPDGGLLFVSSSMPVRDLDAFVPPSERRLTALANRGASGIDGVVSTAVGAAVGGGRSTVAVVGDLAFFHDVNGLLAARDLAPDLVFVVVNNDGGGIFHFLPVREHEPEFTRHFATPHGLEPRDAAELYGLPHRGVESPEALEEAVAEAVGDGGPRVLEVRTDRERNRRLRTALLERVAEAVGRVGFRPGAAGPTTAPARPGQRRTGEESPTE